mmetsp:Transcript_30944/g.72166  ORF Transcript_30944/g.72166 Transcript_30944/m.72166 type:complete len:530 (-) Transcript_30944:228-1817(-)
MMTSGTAAQQPKRNDCELRTRDAHNMGVKAWSLAPGAERPGGAWSTGAGGEPTAQVRSRSGTPRPPVLSPASWPPGLDFIDEGADIRGGHLRAAGDCGTTSLTPPRSFSFAPWASIPPLKLDDIADNSNDDSSSCQTGKLSNKIYGEYKDAAVIQSASPEPSDAAQAGPDANAVLSLPESSDNTGAVHESGTGAPSVGSVGHPYACASACRYVKRKGGCRDGANCPNCHLCFWKRSDGSAAKDAQVTKAAALTNTFVNELPALCMPCTDDAPGLMSPPIADSMVPMPKALMGIESIDAAMSTATVPPPPGLALPNTAEALVSAVISVGSVGHPYKCGLPCKYFGKPRGCKDGKNCRRCHVCVWRHSDAKRLTDEDDEDDNESVSAGTPGQMEPSEVSTDEHVVLAEAASNVLANDAALVGVPAQAQRYPVEPEPMPLSTGIPSVLEDPMKISIEDNNENWSLGSVGHPTHCNQACKYRHRKGGCRDGRQCLCCHLCRWSRHVPPKPSASEFRAYNPGFDLISALHTTTP